MILRTIPLLALAATVTAQEPLLRSKAELVLAPVTVTDRGGQYVRDLSTQDLLLYDDNVLARIRVEDVSAPLSLVIAVQTTPAAQIVLDKLRKSTGVIGPMITGQNGEAAVVAFGAHVEIRQPFTGDEDLVARALRHLDSSGSGAGIADGVDAALGLLAHAKPGRRRVLLLISEKHDLRSGKERMNTSAVLAQQENVTIYSATFSPSLSQWTAKSPVYCDPPPRSLTQAGKCRRCTCGNCGNQCDREDGKPQQYLPPQTADAMNLAAVFIEIWKAAQGNAGETLARFTGGEQTSFTTRAGLDAVLERIGRDVHSQYVLSFAPSQPGRAGFHAIRVEVKGRPDLKVRARPGYWSGGQ